MTSGSFLPLTMIKSSSRIANLSLTASAVLEPTIIGKPYLRQRSISGSQSDQAKRDGARGGCQRRSRKFGQDDKWNFCLTTAIIAVNRRNHEQTTPAEPLSGLQGEGGSGRRQGRPNDSSTGGAFRRPPQSDYGVGGADGGRRLRRHLPSE